MSDKKFKDRYIMKVMMG